MRLSFLGAARMVTGSCYLLEAGGLRLLIDCGLFQGKEEERNREPFGFNPAAIDAVILTHAHIDHSGRLPLLCKQGFRGPIYTHPATADLAEIMLLDSAHIQETEAEQANRKSRRAGRLLVEPLYSQADARHVMSQFRPIPYGQPFQMNEHIQIRFEDAGHILGSALVEIVETGADGRQTKMVFSGDLGQPGRPILRDPTPVAEADYLVLESTYGNRLHEPPKSAREALAEVIRSTIAKGGNVVIPAFAVGRTQEVLYELNGLVESGELPSSLKVVLDSPLAIAATEITAKHADIYDEAAANLVRSGDQPFSFPGLVYSHTADESKALNFTRDPLVIVAASGMCEAGRVLHHLKHNLWKPASTVLFVGFQAQGTLGRRLADGARRVRIYGEDVAVKARIETLHGFSAHADQVQLLDWVDAMDRPPLRTFLVHGESEAQGELARELLSRGHNVEVPALGQSVELQPNLQKLSARARKKASRAARVALADGAALSLSSRRMSAMLRELGAVKKSWFANGPHLPADQAEQLARQAEEVLKSLEEMRRLIDSAGA